MADEKTTLGFQVGERRYVMPAHPTAHIVPGEKPITTDKPESSEETLTDLIAEAVSAQVEELRSELRAELLEEIHAEVQAEIRNEMGGLTDAQIKKSQLN